MKVVLLAHTNCPEDLAEISAKTCYAKNPASEITPTEEHKVLKHAVYHGHESVLEHVTFTFSIEGISRACSHQLVRHRMASYSQQSQRYVTNDEQFDYVIPESIKDCNDLSDMYRNVMENLFVAYDNLIKNGMPAEDARYVLPNACCTNLVVTMNARELRHFFNFRCCTRAQWEIRAVADEMLKICKEVAPTIFANSGPNCVANGYCTEDKCCGRSKHLKDLIKIEEN